MCQSEGRNGSPGAHGMRNQSCGCGCGKFNRQFFSAKEEQEKLEQYSEQLKNELAGVDERIQKITGE
ncbi:hypothetical protein ACFL60_03870 [Candidatus Omnitrophota bacterium]